MVLSDLSLEGYRAMLPFKFLPSARLHHALQGVPCLQHLSVSTSGDLQMARWMGDTLSLVPRLRSLHVHSSHSVQPYDSEWYKEDGFESDEEICMERQVRVATRVSLAALPSLTALTYTRVSLSVQELIDIAAHATLERIQLSSAGCIDWRPEEEDISFNLDDIAEQLEKQQDTEAVMHARDMMEQEEGGEEEEQEQVSKDELSGEEAAVSQHRDLQRLIEALTRVAPSHRSIMARLALTNFISDQLRQRREEVKRSAVVEGLTLSTMCHCQQQLVVLRSTLRDQLRSCHQRRL